MTVFKTVPFNHSGKLPFCSSFQAVNQCAYFERLLGFVVRTGFEPVSALRRAEMELPKRGVLPIVSYLTITDEV
jgi:hypothetical protein